MRTAQKAVAAFALAGLMAAAHVAPLVHLVLVPHVTCAAHGELVHSDGAGSEPVDGELAFTAAAKADTHEHCLTLNAQRTAVVNDFVRGGVTVRPTVEAPGVERAQRPSLAVLALAPKASPPR